MALGFGSEERGSIATALTVTVEQDVLLRQELAVGPGAHGWDGPRCSPAREGPEMVVSVGRDRPELPRHPRGRTHLLEPEGGDLSSSARGPVEVSSVIDDQPTP